MIVKKEASNIAEADEFIRRQKDLEITIDPKAGDMPMSDGKLFSKSVSLGDYLGRAVSKYKLLRDTPYRPSEYSVMGSQAEWEDVSYPMRLAAANEVVTWISKAQNLGMIHEGGGLLAKLEKCREDCKLFEEEAIKFKNLNQKLMQEYKKLEGRYNELNEKHKRTFKENPDSDGT